MPNYRTKTSGNLLQKVIDFLLTNWIVIGIGVILYPLLVRWFRSTEAADQLAEAATIADNPNLLNGALDEITSDAQIKSAAKSIWEGFGFAYGWWDPRHWTEDDEKVYLAITGVTGGNSGNNLELLRQCYYTISGATHDLESDCVAHLDVEYMNLLNW